jgi:hypothetical protein
MSAVRRFGLATLCALTCALGAGTASAVAAEMQVFQSSFHGEGSSQGPFSNVGLGPIGVNQSTGSVLVRDRGHGGVLDQFDPLGNPLEFSGTGSTALSIPVGYNGGSGYNPDKLAIDNSGTASQGNIYLNSEQAGVYGYNAAGEVLSPNYPIPGASEAFCGVAVSPSGSLWVDAIIGFGVIEYSPDGTPTGNRFEATGCPSAFDTDGNFYAGSLFTGVTKYKPNGLGSYTLAGTIGDSGNVTALAVDPTTNDIWVDHGGYLSGYHATDPLVETAPFETVDGLTASNGMAFDGEGNLYVAETGVPSDPASSKVDIFHRQPPSAPVIKHESATDVRSTSAYLNASVVAAGSDTTVRFEFGTSESYGSVLPEIELGNKSTPFSPSAPVTGLTPGTTYHYHVVATNDSGTTSGPDRTFSTYPIPPGGDDPCPNALARKQTGSRSLLDCRAYELVSAADTGGSDVESSLVPGQTPYGGFPLAVDKVLYAVHGGVIPGTGNPTNRGPDPYVASRGADGWSTTYVGIPADINQSTRSFTSTVGSADSSLDTFAFSGAELCKPCFATGIETGIPVRLSDGRLIQGMAGSLDPGPGAEPAGQIAKPLTASGTHLIFGSTSKFEPAGNDNGDLSIYDRDLTTGITSVVSKTPTGATMGGTGIAELDVSADGSRILIGQRAGTDSSGNSYWRLYMNVGDSAQTIELIPGAGEGVLYDGMTADGSRVFFTSTEPLLPADANSSADVYEADVSSSGATLQLVSGGEDSTCDPVPNSNGENWNSVTGAAGCDAVAIGGGGGVASGSGAIYFLSPQLLDGSEGTLDEANLYLERADAAPRFVATLEPNNPAVINALADSGTRHAADFQVTPSGDDAVFVSSRELTGSDVGGNAQVFRYDAATDRLACASCDPTGAEAIATSGDAFLAANGLSITDDGRVFFTTPGALVLNDTDNRLDVYEWAEGSPQLISSGTSQFDSGLLSVSADGTDAFFFTHDDLAEAEDRNGTLTRIYDARAGGGFFAIPPPPPCKASDECHGAGTQAPAPPPIRSAVPGAFRQVRAPKHCKKRQVRKHGKCVRKHRKHHKSHRQHHKKHGRGSHGHA